MFFAFTLLAFIAKVIAFNSEEVNEKLLNAGYSLAIAQEVSFFGEMLDAFLRDKDVDCSDNQILQLSINTYTWPNKYEADLEDVFQYCLNTILDNLERPPDVIKPTEATLKEGTDKQVMPSARPRKGLSFSKLRGSSAQAPAILPQTMTAARPTSSGVNPSSSVVRKIATELSQVDGVNAEIPADVINRVLRMLEETVGHQEDVMVNLIKEFAFSKGHIMNFHPNASPLTAMKEVFLSLSIYRTTKAKKEAGEGLFVLQVADDVASDGNCFYLAVASVLYPEKTPMERRRAAHAMRLETARYMYEHMSEHVGSLPASVKRTAYSAVARGSGFSIRTFAGKSLNGLSVAALIGSNTRQDWEAIDEDDWLMWCLYNTMDMVWADAQTIMATVLSLPWQSHLKIYELERNGEVLVTSYGLEDGLGAKPRAEEVKVYIGYTGQHYVPLCNAARIGTPPFEEKYGRRIEVARERVQSVASGSLVIRS